MVVKISVFSKPRLDTFELMAKGLNSGLLFIPQEKLNTALAILADDSTISRESLINYLRCRRVVKNGTRKITKR
jgi:hypothetical protein